MKKKRKLVNIYLLIASLFLSFCLVELYMRVAKIEYPIFQNFDRERGFSLRPNASGWWTREGKAFVKINSEGLRDVEHNKTKDSKSIRIAVLGDSFTEARPISLDKTFWKLTEKKLNRCIPESYKNITVINFGVTEYSTAQELITLRNNVWEYEPDIILLAFYSGNDITDNSKKLSRKNYRPFFNYKNNNLELDNSFRETKSYKLLSSFKGQLVITLSSYSRVVQLLKEVYLNFSVKKKYHTNIKNIDKSILEEYGAAYQQLYNPSSPEWVEAWKLTEDIILMMNKEVKNKQKEFIVITLSNSRQVHPSKEYRHDFMKSLNINDLFYPDNRIKNLGKKNNFLVFNLAKPMQSYAEKNNIFLHGFENSVEEWKGKGEGHWNSEGHFVASQIISDKICTFSEIFNK
jgi:hypothetical protein